MLGKDPLQPVDEPEGGMGCAPCLLGYGFEVEVFDPGVHPQFIGNPRWDEPEILLRLSECGEDVEPRLKSMGFVEDGVEGRCRPRVTVERRFR
jgi:hypothetical protein